MPSENIRRIVRFLNNKEENGGYWLPNIQRDFVWKEEQITRLFDSVLRQYPIGSFLCWKTKEPILIREFIKHYSSNTKITLNPGDESTKVFVLDGQQRLQSFLIGLKGSYNGKELYIDILSGDEVVAPDDAKYTLRFIKPGSSGDEFPNINLKKILEYEKQSQFKKAMISLSQKELTEDDLDRIGDNYDVITKRLSEEIIQIEMLDGVDNNKYTDEDVVEVFIRANSGGTRLEKSDLLFSLLTASWDDVNKEIEDLLNDLNGTGYKFTRDFVLKTCLILLDKKAKFEIGKFRDPKTRDEFKEKWEEMSEAIRRVKDYVYGKTYIRTLSSYYVLIPLIYFAYKQPKKWDRIKNADTYLIQCLLSGAFSGSADTQQDEITRKIQETEEFNVDEIFKIIKNKHTVGINEDVLLSIKYGGKQLPLIFNLWYRDFNFEPVYNGNMPQVDHIFPQTELKKVKDENKIRKYHADQINQIANLMLLTAEENGAGNKRDILPEKWFADKPEEYLEKHLIPKDKELWKLENYEKFIEERKKLIVHKFKKYLNK